MNFNQLTDEQVDRIKQVYYEKSNTSWEKRAFMLAEEIGVSERTIRKWASERLGLKEKTDVEPEQYTIAKQRKFDKTKKRFIITWGQNNTKIHKGFYEP